MALALLAWGAPPVTAQEIGILQSMQADAFTEAVTAFKVGLARDFPGATFVDLGVVAPGWHGRLAKFHGEALLAVGSHALQTLLAAGEARPIAFTMVLNPRLPAGRRVAGAAMEAAIDEEVALVHRVLPALTRMAGLVFQGAPPAWDAAAGASAQRAGLTWRPITVATVDALPEAIHRAAPFDLLLLPPDEALLTPRAFRVLVSLARREAFGILAPSPPFVRAGAAAAVEVSWAESGVLAAIQMGHLLRGAPPEPTILYPKPTRLWLHQERAHDLHWLPQPGSPSPLLYLWEER